MEDPEGGGLVPIMIGRRAVDPVTGELSPIIGVRTNPETKTVVPVTQSSGGHRKRKPPVGAQAVLEDEIAARRSFWRRQRQREQDLTWDEFVLAQKCLYDIDNVTAKSVEHALEKILEKARELDDSAKRETQRRSDEEQEYSSILPPDVLAVLTEGDEKERKAEEVHHAAHKKFAETVGKFFQKLQAEEARFKEKMADLEGAMNPEAENVTKMRYDQARARLCAELKDHILTKMENLDEDHSSLEYIRQCNELLTVESRAVLLGQVLMAGEYDCIIPGVYGETDLTSSSSNHELVPLLKQLISLLESGGPFMLSPELLNIIQGGDINVYGGPQMPPPAHTAILQPTTVAQQQAPPVSQQPPMAKKMEVGHVQRAAPAADAELNTDMNATALIDVDHLKTQATNDEERKNKMRDLITKQTYEAAKLENDLRSEEINSINEVNETIRKQKEEAAADLTKSLQEKMSKAKTDAEREKLMMEHAANLQKLTDGLDKQKQKQMDALRQKLLDRRRKGKKDLHRQHIMEAKALGLPPDVVPDMTIPTHDELDLDLRRLAHEQEQQLATLERAAAEENVKDAPLMDEEMEARIKSLNLDSNQEKELLEEFKKQEAEVAKKTKEYRDKLRARADRNKQRETAGLEGLTEDEKRAATEAMQNMLEADRVKEENALLKALAFQERLAQKRSQLAALQKMTENKSKADQQRILDQYEADLRRLQSQQEDSRSSQQESVLAKLAARKRMREELKKEEAVATELDRITKAQAAKGDEESAAIISQISSELNKPEASAQEQTLHNEQEMKLADLYITQQNEDRKARQKLEDEKEANQREVDDQIEQQKRLAMEEERAKYDREILLQGKNLSEEEFQRLLAAHQAAQDELNKNFENERNRQKRSIEDKIAARRRVKEARLAEQHQLELNNELMKQQQERDAANMKAAKDIESTTLKDALKDKDGQQAENMIYTVLRQRHMKEAVHLEDQLERERKAKIAQARSDVATKRAEERETLSTAFEQEMLELMSNSAGLSSSELEQRKEELTKQHQRHLSDFDNLTAQLIERAEKELLPQLEVEGMNARLDLKERHLKEIHDAMVSLSPKDVLLQQYEEEAKRAAEEAAKYRATTLKQMQQELERMKAERLRKDEEAKRRMAQQLANMEADLEAERKREELREKARVEEREKTRRKQLEEKEKRERAEIEMKNLSEDEKTKLLREHDENLKRFDEALKKEQEKSKASLQAKLEARRRRKGDISKARLEKDALLAAEAEKRDDVLEKLKEDAVTKSRAKTAAPAPTGAKPGAAPFTPTGNAEEDWINMLMASPLFQQINDIQDLIDKNIAAATGGKNDLILGADYGQPYIDVKDAQWMCQGDLSPVDINDISASSFVMYRFGVFVIRLLRNTIKTPDVTLLLASNLPQNNYERNCFRKSFFYERARKVLFVRHERMESIGDFILVIVHCLAHIKIDDLTDDANPLFLREFYKALKIVCQDMFFSRSKSTPTAQNLMGTPAGHGGRKALESAFEVAKNQDDRSIVTSELLEVKVTDPTEAEFSEQAMSQRLEGYERVNSQAQLRQILSAQGGVRAQGDIVAMRLAELKGHPATPDGALKSSRRPRTVAGSRITSQRDLIESQLNEMEAKGDGLNSELAQLLKQESDLQKGLKVIQSDPSKADEVISSQEQLTGLAVKKNEMMKRIAHLENDISEKRKALSKAK